MLLLGLVVALIHCATLGKDLPLPLCLSIPSCSVRELVCLITKGSFHPLMPVQTFPLMYLTSLPLAAAEATFPSFVCTL